MRTGDRVAMVRSGHSCGASEAGTVVALRRTRGAAIARIRWEDGRETFVPVTLLQGSATNRYSVH